MLWRKDDNIAGQSRGQADRESNLVALLTIGLCGSMFLVVSRLKESYSSPIVLATTDKPQEYHIGNVTHKLESSALNSNGNLTGNPNSTTWARAALVGADSTITLIMIYIDVLFGIACGTIALVRLGLSSRPIASPRLSVFILMIVVIAFANYLAFRLTTYVLAGMVYEASFRYKAFNVTKGALATHYRHNDEVDTSEPDDGHPSIANVVPYGIAATNARVAFRSSRRGFQTFENVMWLTKASSMESSNDWLNISSLQLLCHGCITITDQVDRSRTKYYLPYDRLESYPASLDKQRK